MSNDHLERRGDERIQRNFTYLVETLDPKDIMNESYEAGLITMGEKQQIHDSSRQDVRFDSYFGFMKKKQNWYPKFLNILRNSELDYDHIIEKLANTIFEEPGNPLAWVDELPERIKQLTLRDKDVSRLSSCFGKNWEHLFIELDFSFVEIEREKEISNNPSTCIMPLLIKWGQRQSRSATIERFLTVLRSKQEVSVDWNKIKKLMDLLQQEVA